MKRRRRIPELFDFDYPSSLGVVQNQESYAQGVAAQRPFYFDHIAGLADRAFEEYEALTGRRYERADGLSARRRRLRDRGPGLGRRQRRSRWPTTCREKRRLKVGVLNLVMFRPFPADLVTSMLAGKKGVIVLERTDQPLAVELPMIREIRSAMAQAAENGRAINGAGKRSRRKKHADDGCGAAVSGAGRAGGRPGA